MLGFGFNKERTRVQAERYVQQNKLSNAIAEYEKIAKRDPRDLNVLNTIGDLCARLGRVDKAVANFRQVGEAYAKDGFTVKAIAVHKKIVKLDPNLMECVERLAELYSDQRLPLEARAQFATAADGYVRAGNGKEAIRVLRRVVELDPENIASLARLADLLVAAHKQLEAHEILFKAATTLFERRSFDQAGQVLGRALQLDPNDMRAHELRGRVLLELDDPAGAIASFQRVADLDAHADAVRALLRAYLQCDRMADAKALAQRLLENKNDASGIYLLVNRLFSEEKNLEALRLLDEFADVLISSDTKQIDEHLHDCLPHVKDDPESLGLLQKLLHRAGDLSQTGEVLELRAHACASQGDLPTARELYFDLCQMEPDNPTHIQAYRQLCARTGERSPRDQGTAEDKAITDFEEKLAMEQVQVAQEYPPQIEEMVRLALTEGELCESLGAPANALPTLEAALARVPDDVRVNRRLASIYVRTNEPDAARRCYATLYRVYQQAGHADEAQRFARLAGIEPEPHKDSPSAQPAIPAYMLEEPEEHGYGTVEEVDLSSEWQDVAKEGAQAGPAPGALRDLLEEIRFYLTNGMWSDAKQGVDKLARMSPNNPLLPRLRQEVEKNAAGAGQGIELVVEDVEEEASPPPAAPPAAPKMPAPTPAQKAPQEGPKATGMASFAAELEASLGADFVISEPSAPAPAPARPAAPPAPPVQRAQPAAAPASASAKPSSPPKPAPPPAASSTGIFSDLVAEASKDLGDGNASAEDDPDTHYSLGIAFREMGLMDEAIGELQKVCSYIDAGHNFPQALQAYTWLAACLVGEGMPEAAYQWYERALKVAVDADSRNAIHYDLASAYEAAGRRREALEHYLAVMGSNIDFRDTAMKVRELRSTVA